MPTTAQSAMDSVMYSVVIPVYNSEGIVGETIDRTAAFFEARGWAYELILVNDGSADESWEVLASRARENPNLIALDLARNYGQHTALFFGIQLARGDYIINMDDDLQNPPEELGALIAKVQEGHDLVFASFIVKKHGLIRRVGSRVIAALDRLFFGRPKDLAVTNFRIFSREVADKIRAHRAPYPYLRGLLLIYAVNPANARVQHRERTVGVSNYTPGAIIATLLRIVFNAALASPLRVTVIGILTAGIGIVILTLALSQSASSPSSVGTSGLIFLAGICTHLGGIALLISGFLGWLIPRSKAQGDGWLEDSVREMIVDQTPSDSKPLR